MKLVVNAAVTQEMAKASARSAPISSVRRRVATGLMTEGFGSGLERSA